MLEEDPDLEGVTHVLVDEVHERTVENDFLLLTLRDLIEKEEDAKGDCKRDHPLHVCLMSATLDSNVLTKYFGKCPRVSMPGRTFPVTTLHLEDAVYLTRRVSFPTHRPATPRLHHRP